MKARIEQEKGISFRPYEVVLTVENIEDERHLRIVLGGKINMHQTWAGPHAVLASRHALGFTSNVGGLMDVSNEVIRKLFRGI